MPVAFIPYSGVDMTSVTGDVLLSFGSDIVVLFSIATDVVFIRDAVVLRSGELVVGGVVVVETVELGMAVVVEVGPVGGNG